MKKARAIRVFSDFDGTISAKDVGASLFNHFSIKKNRGTVQLWIEQKISSRECLWRECSYINASKQELLAALDRIDIRKGFPEFVSFLKTRSIPLHIVSDGLDFYIRAFLARNGFEDLDVHANNANFVNGNLYPSFPYFVKGCGFCGCCKGERIRSLSHNEELTIFIGDGFSDRCALDAADVVFARDDLEALCREKSVDCLPFADFFDVINHVEREIL
jgi:2-hydroxy-3-keto-5-methylthiopentenyl-1-phosphate phosphatase